MVDKTPPIFMDRQSPPHIGTLIVLAGLSALSMNLFLPSLPVMTEYFNTEYRLMQLSVALYLFMAALGQVIIGPLSDRFGRRSVMLWSILVFMLATLGCILATNIWVFLGFRMAQAAVVAGIVLSRAVVRDIAPTERAASMIGYVTMGMSLVPMVGPMLGGALGQAFGWQSNFWLLLTLGGVVLWLAWSDMGETFTSAGGSFREQARQYPELLTSRRFWGYCLAATFASGAFFAYLGGAPYVGDAVFGLPPARLGFYFGAPALGYLVGNFITGRFSMRIGIHRMLLIGAILLVLGLIPSLLLFRSSMGSAEIFFGFMTIIGLGNGMVLPNANAGMLSVRPRLAGSAAGLGGAIMIGGGALLSGYSGALLRESAGAMPLLWLMFASAVLSLMSVLWVIRAERRLG
ncbi:MAG TPA: Bcr/CflA family efflux MFS transporter [Aliiroseovarius sp.]|nr:Bcr/CflA family efflux MFS transporter [Aliiroseovarius sp.]